MDYEFEKLKEMWNAEIKILIKRRKFDMEKHPFVIEIRSLNSCSYSGTIIVEGVTVEAASQLCDYVSELMKDFTVKFEPQKYQDHYHSIIPKWKYEPKSKIEKLKEILQKLRATI